MKYPQKYLMTYCSDTVMPCILKKILNRSTKGCILLFSKKGDLRLAKNYWGMTLTSIAAKIYNALQRNWIEPKIENILRKNQNGFRKNESTTSQIWTIRRILEDVPAAAGIGLHVNAHKTEYICFNQRGNISIQNGSSQKLVDEFSYLGSGVSSTETGINTWLAKAWTAIDSLSVIRK